MSGVLNEGAQGRNRTTDTVIFSHVLYRLSYLGEKTICADFLGKNTRNVYVKQLRCVDIHVPVFHGKDKKYRAGAGSVRQCATSQSPIDRVIRRFSWIVRDAD